MQLVSKVVIVSSSCIALVACSSSAPTPSSGTGSPTSAPTTAAPVGSAAPTTPAPLPSSPPTSSPTTPPAGGGECGASTTYDACSQCCDSKHAAGAQVYGPLQETAFTCVCSKCAAQCGTNACAASNPTDPTPACEQCMDAETTCNTQAETECGKNAECAAVMQCYTTSQCDEKN